MKQIRVIINETGQFNNDFSVHAQSKNMAFSKANLVKFDFNKGFVEKNKPSKGRMIIFLYSLTYRHIRIASEQISVTLKQIRITSKQIRVIINETEQLNNDFSVHAQ